MPNGDFARPDLNEGKNAAVSAYCLQFLPEHLKQARASPEKFMIMVENGWRLAWEKFEGGPRGFASAARSALEALKHDENSLRIGAKWRCALTLSSFKSLGENVPAEASVGGRGQGRDHHPAGDSLCRFERSVDRERRVAVGACARTQR